MKHIIKWTVIAIYFSIAYLLKYLLNFLELIWYCDLKHFSSFDRYFYTLEIIKHHNVNLNLIEKIIYNLIKE